MNPPRAKFGLTVFIDIYVEIHHFISLLLPDYLKFYPVKFIDDSKHSQTHVPLETNLAFQK